MASYIVLLAAISIVSAHTWLGCTKMVGNQCQGYIRNYVGRNTPTAAVDDYYTHKALGRPNDFPLCKPDSQATSKYSSQYPMATANAGETIRVMYTPNGHSQPGDPGLRTTARIHWTGSSTQTLRTRADLNDGNRLTQWNYGQNCATSGDVASLPCVNGFTIPSNTPTGVYQFVWYWPYDRDQNQRPLGEEYYSCFDVSVTGTAQPPVTSQPQTSQQQQTSQPQTSQQQTSNQMTSNQMTSNQMTSNQMTSNPATSNNVGLCANALDDCKSFCAPSAPSVCDCDPATGGKTVKCAIGEELASDGRVIMVGLSLISAMLALL